VVYVGYYPRNPQAPAITLSYPEPIRLGQEDGKILTVSLRNGIFAERLNAKSWSVENVPARVTLGAVERVSEDTQISLAKTLDLVAQSSA
jgi:hypothetical protein